MTTAAVIEYTGLPASRPIRRWARHMQGVPALLTTPGIAVSRCCTMIVPLRWALCPHPHSAGGAMYAKDLKQSRCPKSVGFFHWPPTTFVPRRRHTARLVAR